MVYRITEIDFAPVFDESDFTIDPALADTVYDSDNNVTISVPK